MCVKKPRESCWYTPPDPEPAAHAPQPSQETAKPMEVCKVREAGTTDPPQDCDFPHCGCFAMALKAVEAMIEEGWREPTFTLPESAPEPAKESEVERLRTQIIRKSYNNSGAEPSLSVFHRAIDAFEAAVRKEALEEAAKVAENVRGGYTANIRVDVSEQELVPHHDGPWVLNSDVARAIRDSTR